MPLNLKSVANGSVILNPASTVTDKTITIPATDGTMVVQDSSNITSVTNLAYTGTLTGGTGVINIGSGQVYKDASGNVAIGVTVTANTRLSMRTATATDALIAADNGVNTGFKVQFANNLTSVGNDFNNPLALLTNNVERMRIDSSGRLLVGTASVLVKDSKLGSYSTAANQFASFFDHQSTVNAYGLGIRSRTGENIYFYNGTGESPVGSVTTTGSTTAYNTSSDYRLKENVAPMTGALQTVAALKPCTYTWKADGSAGQGFIAHELQAVVPDCVTGEKDAVQIVDELDEEGNKIGTKEVPQYQGVDTSFLVATLVAAIQELKAEFDAYKLTHP